MSSVTIVLLQPPGACRAFTRSGSVYPPLGLCHLASVAGPSVGVVDADGMGWGEDETVARVLDLAPLAVGMTLTSYTVPLVNTFARRFRQAGLTVIVGGPHASLAPQDTFARCPDVDWVVRGEAEVVIEDLVLALQSDRSPWGLSGVCVRRGDTVRVADDISRITDLESQPVPAFDGLPIDEYWCPDAKRRPMVTYVTSRGCPQRCGFCSSPQLMGRRFRRLSAASVVEQIGNLVTALGVREVSFVDDVFSLHKRRLLDICRGIARAGLDVSWFCNVRADQIDQEMAVAMAAAGCHQAYIGFESGSQAILDRVHKDATVAQLERGAAYLASAGIDRSVGFVVGLPGETDETVRRSIELARRVRPERIQFTRFTPLVGSPLAAARSNGTFHSGEDDQVQGWIDSMYDSVACESWGRVCWCPSPTVGTSPPRGGWNRGRGPESF